MPTKYRVVISADEINTELVDIYMSGEQEALKDALTGELLAELMARSCGDTCVVIGKETGWDASRARFELEF